MSETVALDARFSVDEIGATLADQLTEEQVLGVIRDISEYRQDADFDRGLLALARELVTGEAPDTNLSDVRRLLEMLLRDRSVVRPKYTSDAFGPHLDASGTRVFGYSLQQVREMVDFAILHGWEFTGPSLQDVQRCQQ